MSLVLRELDERLPLAAAVAVCDALPVEAAIKWPNDVWIEGRKVAGILVEGRPQEGWAVLGVGLNVTHRGLPARAGRHRHLASAWPASTRSPEHVLDDLLASLATWLGAPPARVLEAWRERDALRGQRVRWAGGEGVADGIDDSGALLVETARRPVALDAGEVHLLR